MKGYSNEVQSGAGDKSYKAKDGYQETEKEYDESSSRSLEHPRGAMPGHPWDDVPIRRLTRDTTGRRREGRAAITYDVGPKRVDNRCVRF